MLLSIPTHQTRSCSEQYNIFHCLCPYIYILVSYIFNKFYLTWEKCKHFIPDFDLRDTMRCCTCMQCIETNTQSGGRVKIDLARPSLIWQAEFNNFFIAYHFLCNFFLVTGQAWSSRNEIPFLTCIKEKRHRNWEKKANRTQQKEKPSSKIQKTVLRRGRWTFISAACKSPRTMRSLRGSTNTLQSSINFCKNPGREPIPHIDWDGVQGQYYKVNVVNLLMSTFGLVLDYYDIGLRYETWHLDVVFLLRLWPAFTTLWTCGLRLWYLVLVSVTSFLQITKFNFKALS